MVKLTLAEKQARFTNWKSAAAKMTPDGKLPANEVFEAMYNKISRQFIEDTFTYENKILNRYLIDTGVTGGISEIVGYGLGHLEQYDPNADWTKEHAIPELFVTWAPVTFEDKYIYTIMYDQMARAFIEMGTFNSILDAMYKSILDQRVVTWYNRIIALHKEYSVVVEVDIADMESVGKTITATMLDMENPSDKYNSAGKINATPLSEQRITWNTKYLNEIQWQASRLFDRSVIDALGSALTSNQLNYGDDDIVAILDTDRTLHIERSFEVTDSTNIASLKKVNHYMHETYLLAVLIWENGVIFKAEGSTKPKKN